MRILMIGGTEFFGKLLVDRLLHAGHEVTLLTRGNKKPAEFWSRVSHIECDRTHYADFKSKLEERNFDVVIDNVVSGRADIESIIDVFASKERPPQYIFCSSVAVYPDWSRVSGELDERSASLELEAGDDWKIAYANGKREAEKYLVEHHGAMPYTIMRPTVIEGPEDPHKRTWFWIQRLQDGAPIILSTRDLHTLYRHVSPVDVAQAFFLAVGNEKAFNQTYNVAGKEVLTIKEYIRHLANVLGKEDIALCWLPEAELNRELPGYALPPFFERVRLTSNIGKIRAELGYEPQDTDTWLEETVKAFSEEAVLSQGYEHRDDERRVADAFKKNFEILPAPEREEHRCGCTVS